MTCPHGDHPPCCMECLETTPPKPEPRETADSRPFRARIMSTCSACSQQITEDLDDIVHTTRDRFVHVECVGLSR